MQTATRQHARAEKPLAKPRRKRKNKDARIWLRQNGYNDVADMIDVVMQRWEAEGKSTRRNWWDTLSGGVDGRPYTIDGQEFPVLVAAQRRQHKPVTANAIQRNVRENVPAVRRDGRWPSQRSEP
jgi:hypothetical protein